MKIIEFNFKICLIFILSFVVISCENPNNENCNKLEMTFIISEIKDKLPEHYKMNIDTLEDGKYMLSIITNMKSQPTHENYLFDQNKKLIGYYYYNDFQESNPLIFSLSLINGCLDNLKFDGSALCYRIYELDSSDVVYINAATPIFMKSILELEKRNKNKKEIFKDSVKLSNNMWSYGVYHKSNIRVEYNFNIKYFIKKEYSFQDTLKIILPTNKN